MFLVKNPGLSGLAFDSSIAFFSWFFLTSPSAEGESYESLKQKGLKSWLSENLESAKGMATRHLDQRNVYHATDQTFVVPQKRIQNYRIHGNWLFT